MRLPFPALIPLMILVASVAEAQAPLRPSADADRLFREANQSFARGEFRAAIAGYDRVLREFPASQRTTAAQVMKGKAHVRLGAYIEGVRTLRMFLTSSPASSYVPDAAYTLGVAYTRMDRHDEALRQYYAAWRAASERDPLSPVARNAERSVDLTLERFPNPAALEALRAEASSPREQSFLWLRLAEVHVARGSMEAALAAIDTINGRYAGMVSPERLARAQRAATERTAVTVGAILPLMRSAPPSALKEIGNDVHDGILFALEELQRTPGSRVTVTLAVRDTERDPEKAELAAQELTEDPKLIGILGPVFSATTMPVAAVANARRVSVVSPTANAGGIAAVGPYVFQANADYESRARAIARFAVSVRGWRTLAILAPAEASSRQMAEEFKRTVMSLGARVVATEWYERGAADLSKQIAAIRRAAIVAGADPMITFAGKLNRRDIAGLIALGVRPKTIDSLVEKSRVVSATWLLGPNARALIDSMNITALYASPLADSLDTPVTDLEAVYFPISSPSEIGVVSSQLVYYNIRAQVLGSAEWNNHAELDKHRRYTTGVIFESDSWIDPADTALATFTQRYVAARKKKPGRNVLYGYDAARLMFTLISGGATTRESLRDALAGVREYRGLKSNIGFTGRRVNSWVHLLGYDGEEVRRLDQVDLDSGPAAGRVP